MTGGFTRHVIATDVPGVHMVKLLDIDGDDMFDVCYAYNDGLGWCVFMLCACVCTYVVTTYQMWCATYQMWFTTSDLWLCLFTGTLVSRVGDHIHI